MEEMEEQFIELCTNGNLELAKKLFDDNPNIDISSNDEEAFRSACINGHLDVAKWLISVKPSINVSFYDEEAFRWACINGYLDVAKWLISVRPSINISIFNEEAFRLSCTNGRLEVVKWLLEKKHDIDISTQNDFAFRWTCKNGWIKVAEWFHSLYPEKYFIEVEDDKLVSYKVNIPITFIDKVILKKEQIETCPICEQNECNVQSSCKHSYCKECILTWLDSYKRTCPYCRETINYNTFYKIEDL